MTTRIAIVGGFLGAGKTTLILAAARRLAERGYRVGLVTNDQGEDLVDTALAVGAEIPVAEVAGGCFCCRFPDLLAGLQRLQEVAAPDLILAEPVGSCTDLIATVLRPLVQFYGEQYALAPLTVLLDSSRSLADFPDDIRYLHEQQVAEAEILLHSKSDLIGKSNSTAESLQTHRGGAGIAESSGDFLLNSSAFSLHPPRLRGEIDLFTGASKNETPVLPVSAVTGEGLDEWLSMILGQTSRNPAALLIDYERYAAAEAALGWLNAKGQVRADAPYAAREWTARLLGTLEALCAEQGASIAHIKALATTPESKVKASLTQTGSLTWDLDNSAADTRSHEFVLNARVNATPGQLEQMALQAIEAAKPDAGARYYIEHFECFSPLPPRPTHRL